MLSKPLALLLAAVFMIFVRAENVRGEASIDGEAASQMLVREMGFYFGSPSERWYGFDCTTPIPTVSSAEPFAVICGAGDSKHQAYFRLALWDHNLISEEDAIGRSVVSMMSNAPHRRVLESSSEVLTLNGIEFRVWHYRVKWTGDQSRYTPYVTVALFSVQGRDLIIVISNGKYENVGREGLPLKEITPVILGAVSIPSTVP